MEGEPIRGFRELLVSVRVAGIELSGGRATPRLGPGRDDLLAPGTHPLDGVGLSSVSPFRLPGPLGFLGAISVATSVHPMDRVGPVEDPWYGILAISTDPIPAWRIGVLRSAVFGGEGVPPVTAGRVARMIAGWHSTNQGEFEDQYAEFFTRLRVGLGEFPLVVYGALAVNDSEAAYRDDPGLLAGVLVPLSVPGWLGALRYEYLAVGAGASLCPLVWGGTHTDVVQPLPLRDARDRRAPDGRHARWVRDEARAQVEGLVRRRALVGQKRRSTGSVGRS